MHYVVGVIVENPDVDEYSLELVLDKFGEHIEVAPYQEECWCVGKAQVRDAMVQTDNEVGTQQKLREDLEGTKGMRKLRQRLARQQERMLKAVSGLDCPDTFWRGVNGKKLIKERSETSDKISLLLRKATEPWSTRYNEILQTKNLTIPDPECEECVGGTRTTTFNPDAKWDWWVIGGRWSGLYSDYEPDQDQDNWSVCDLCDANGSREWLELPEEHETFLGHKIKLAPVPGDQSKLQKRLNEGAKIVVRECNACGGKKKKRNFGNAPRDTENVVPISTVLKMVAEGEAHLPYALLEPDGTWHEQDTGWDGKMLQFREPEQDWDVECKALIEKHKGKYLVVVDYHS